MKNIGVRTGAFHLLLGWLAVFLLIVPQTAFAHTTLKEAEPAAGSVLEEAPEAVRLTFSARLENGLYDIKVYDGTGQEVTTEKPALSDDRKEVSVALPVLPPGAYTVSYQVMSADGHAVSDAYEFRIADTAAGQAGDAADAGQPEQDGQNADERAQGDGNGEEPQGHAHHDAAGGHDQHDSAHDHGHESGHAHHDVHGSEDPHNHAHHDATDGGEAADSFPLRSLSKGIDGREWLLHGVKAVYLGSMLLFAGLALWALWRGFASSADTAAGSASGAATVSRARLETWQGNALRVFVLALIAWIGIELPALISDWSADKLASLARTSLGRLWIVQLLLAAAGLVASGMRARDAESVTGKTDRKPYLAAGIAVLLLAVKTTSGHAAAAEPAWASVAGDFIHLMAAALWIGGLLALLILWRTERERLTAFLQAFSRFAWISIAVLAASGAAMTLLLLPNLRYLLYSPWGTFLLVKIAVVVLVIPVAYAIRREMKRRSAPAGKWVAADFALALAIVVIAAVLTGMSPVPENKPLHWHVMGSDIHMTADISPNNPGINRFAVKVWLPEQDGEPEQVQLQLVPLSGGNGLAPVDIPIAPSEDLGEKDFFPGFTRYDYAAEGDWLAYPGDWQVRVTVTAPGGNVYIFVEEMRIY
jgi:putative copper export protein/methionine-rich copper-binding protein CopC